MGVTCSSVGEIRSEFQGKQQQNLSIENEIPINQPNSIMPKLNPQIFDITLEHQFSAMEFHNQQQLIDDCSSESRTNLKDLLKLLKGNYEDSIYLKKLKTKSRQKRKRVTMKDLEQLF